MKLQIEVFLTPFRATAIAAAGSFLLLAGAHAFERIGKFEPCMLCLDQREAHWTALIAALIVLAVQQIRGGATRAVAAGLGVLSLIYAFSTGLAAYHSGVEWKWWPGPATCSGSQRIDSAADLFDKLETAPIVSCSEAAWRMFGLSMAGYNVLFSLALTVLTGLAAWRLIQTLRDNGFARPGMAL